MEIYVGLKWYHGPKIQMFIVEEDRIGIKFYKDCLNLGIGYTPEWHKYIKDTRFQIKPRVDNIFKIPSKIINSIRMQRPPEEVVSSKRRSF